MKIVEEVRTESRPIKTPKGDYVFDAVPIDEEGNLINVVDGALEKNPPVYQHFTSTGIVWKPKTKNVPQKEVVEVTYFSVEYDKPNTSQDALDLATKSGVDINLPTFLGCKYVGEAAATTETIVNDDEKMRLKNLEEFVGLNDDES